MSHIKSFVIRGGRITSAQKKALENGWSKFGIDSEHFLDLLDWLAHPEVVLEIGFGNGESLHQMASNLPHVRFLGVEVHLPGVGRLIRKAGETNLGNLKIMSHDIYELFAQGLFPKHCFKRVQIYFPDPWHKTRYAKRRLVQAPFLKHLDACIAPKGRFHFVSDHAPYFRDVMHQMRCLGYVVCDLSSDQKTFGIRPLTAFESKAQQAQTQVNEVIFQKT